MAYSSDIAALLTRQLTKLTTLNRYQLAGQVANLDFWLSEIRHCFAVIDAYRERFQKLKKAESAHVADHGTMQLDFSLPCCIEVPATAPRRVPHTELGQARRDLADAAQRFLLRCFHESFIDESKRHELFESLGLDMREIG